MLTALAGNPSWKADNGRIREAFINHGTMTAVSSRFPSILPKVSQDVDGRRNKVSVNLACVKPSGENQPKFWLQYLANVWICLKVEVGNIAAEDMGVQVCPLALTFCGH